MAMSERARKAAAVMVDYAATLPRHQHAFVSVYLTRLPTEAYEAVADLFDFVKSKW